MSNFFSRSARFRLLQLNKECVGGHIRTVNSWGHYLRHDKKHEICHSEFLFKSCLAYPAFYEKPLFSATKINSVEYGPDLQKFDKY